MLLSAALDPSELELSVIGGAWFGTVGERVPAFRVELRQWQTGDLVDDSGPVTISSEFLVRPQTVQAHHGVAVFDDLVFSTVGEDVFDIDWGGVVQVESGWFMYILPSPDPALPGYGLRNMDTYYWAERSLGMDSRDNLVVGTDIGDVFTMPLLDGDSWSSGFYDLGYSGEPVITEDLVVDANGNVFGSIRIPSGYYGNYMSAVFEIRAADRSNPILHSLDWWFGDAIESVAIDPRGNVFAVSSEALFEIPAGTSDFHCVMQFPYGTWVTDMTVDPFGDIYLAAQDSILVIPAGTSDMKVLHQFSDLEDISQGIHGLTVDNFGNVFGFTRNEQGPDLFGGANDDGKIFEIAAGSGNFRTLHTFHSEHEGAAFPAAIVLDGWGNLVGVTTRGGPSNSGVLFEIDPVTGSYAEYALTGEDGRGEPLGTLVVDSAGNIYGIREAAWSTWYRSDGTIFQLMPDQKPPARIRGARAGAVPRAGLPLRDEPGVVLEPHADVHPANLNVFNGHEIALPGLRDFGVHVGAPPAAAPSPAGPEDADPEAEGESDRPAATQPAKTEKKEPQEQVGGAKTPRPELLAAAPPEEQALEPDDLAPSAQQARVRIEPAAANSDEGGTRNGPDTSSMATIFAAGAIVGESERRRRQRILRARRKRKSPRRCRRGLCD